MATFKTYETAWCPGCGNFAILDSLKTALEELNKEPNEVLMAAGIGQAAKTAYLYGRRPPRRCPQGNHQTAPPHRRAGTHDSKTL